mgnify:CR=1 FL=1
MNAQPLNRNLSRRERERLMRRRAKLQAARSVFAEKCYARATPGAIAGSSTSARFVAATWNR